MTSSQRVLVTLAGFVLLGSFPAKATEYPYCMTHAEGWSGLIERCDYSTMAQCQASAGGLGGSCAPNWRLAYTRGAQPAAVAPESTVGRRTQR